MIHNTYTHTHNAHMLRNKCPSSLSFLFEIKQEYICNGRTDWQKMPDTLPGMDWFSSSEDCGFDGLVGTCCNNWEPRRSLIPVIWNSSPFESALCWCISDLAQDSSDNSSLCRLRKIGGEKQQASAVLLAFKGEWSFWQCLSPDALASLTHPKWLFVLLVLAWFVSGVCVLTWKL